MPHITGAIGNVAFGGGPIHFATLTAPVRPGSITGTIQMLNGAGVSTTPVLIADDGAGNLVCVSGGSISGGAGAVNYALGTIGDITAGGLVGGDHTDAANVQGAYNYLVAATPISVSKVIKTLTSGAASVAAPAAQPFNHIATSPALPWITAAALGSGPVDLSFDTQGPPIIVSNIYHDSMVAWTASPEDKIVTINITVYVTVNNLALVVQPTAFQFNSERNNALPPTAKLIAVTSSEPAIIQVSNLAIASVVYSGNIASWLSSFLDNTVTPTNLELSIAIPGGLLDVGTSTATITLSGDNVPNKVIVVTLKVGIYYDETYPVSPSYTDESPPVGI